MYVYTHKPVYKSHIHNDMLVTITLLFQSVARGGVAVEVTFEYVMKWKMRLYVCVNCSEGIELSIHNMTCLEVYDCWPNNRIEIYAWYQLRQIEYCEKDVWGVTIVSDLICL